MKGELRYSFQNFLLIFFNRLSVRQLKDTIQLSLLQQSEYLRRFSLAFCQKVIGLEIPDKVLLSIAEMFFIRFKRMMASIKQEY